MYNCEMREGGTRRLLVYSSKTNGQGREGEGMDEERGSGNELLWVHEHVKYYNTMLKKQGVGFGLMRFE